MAHLSREPRGLTGWNAPRPAAGVSLLVVEPIFCIQQTTSDRKRVVLGILLNSGTRIGY